MAYTKTIWVDETLAGSPTYNISGTGAGQTITLDQTITQAGTNFNASNMNNIEDGIEEALPMTTAGDVQYHNGTIPVRLAIGTAGQVLKVNSGATAPEWANITNLVASASLSGSSVTISDLDINADGGFYEILVEADNSATAELYMEINGLTTGYEWRYDAIGTTSGGSGSNPPRIGSIGTSGTTKHIEMMLFDGQASAYSIDFRRTSSQHRRYGWYNAGSISNITSIKFYPSTGTFSSGTVKIYKRS